MLLDDRGFVLAEYTYDAWGNVTVTGDAALAKTNPFTYRGAYGYYYDWETGLYYLQSRYYDPQTCRFVNADQAETLKDNQGSVLGYNFFAYCLNNPIMKNDPTGYGFFGKLFKAIKRAVVSIIDRVKHIAKAIMYLGKAVTTILGLRAVNKGIMYGSRIIAPRVGAAIYNMMAMQTSARLIGPATVAQQYPLVITLIVGMVSSAAFFVTYFPQISSYLKSAWNEFKLAFK